ncbi:thioredoxin domain-containing protein [Tribonema minus]|uniref:Thioredoxin domain-containing protein n=1 Tax=Tribonema minus TaxID=303371 RepID=A0A836CGC7_9STRA|nr:thioredoxin domain-containing protein [Tribonema minus]
MNLRSLSRLLLLPLLLALALTSLGRAEDTEAIDDDFPKAEVVLLTEQNFEHLTQASTGATTGDWFVKLYAPWCGHCKRLEPTWDELAAAVAARGVNVAKVDVTANRRVGERFGVRGFPTLLLLHAGRAYTYRGPRTLEKLTEFAAGGYAAAESVPVPPPRGGALAALLSTVRKDLAAVPQGKVPSFPTLAALLPLALVVIVALASALAPKKKKPAAAAAAPAVAPARKAD